MMEDRPKVVKFLGKEIPRSSVETALYSATAFFLVFNALSIPFALPKLRACVGAPYLPSSRTAFRSVLEHVPELQRDGVKMVDIGSGDGRLVLEASKRGMNAMGIELNPWLVFLSRLKMRIAGTKSPIVCMNAWKSGPTLEKFEPDLLTFYGRPGQGVMNRFGALAEDLSDRTGKQLIVVSNKFPIPGWNVRLVAHVEDFFIYKLHSNRH
jgi:hypothetical protein